MSTHAWMLIPVAALSVCVVTGCSSDGSSPGPGGPAGGAGAGGSPSGGTGGGGGDIGGVGGSGGTVQTGGSAGDGGSAASGGSGGASLTKYGYVSLVQSVLTIQGTEYASHSISAAFVDNSENVSGWTCTQDEHGECVTYDCSGATSDGGTPSYAQASAGTIRIKAGANTVNMTPQPDNTYTPVTGQTRLWDGGETLEVKADGADVPSFSGVLTGVEPALVQTPSFPTSGAPMTIARNQNLVLSWTGGSYGKVFVILARSESSGGTTHSVSATCTFDASAGSGTVPSTVLMAIPAGQSGSVSVNGGDKATLTAGDWSITLQEYVPASTPGGTAAAALATFE
jgi:hypothetical protein